MWCLWESLQLSKIPGSASESPRGRETVGEKPYECEDSAGPSARWPTWLCIREPTLRKALQVRSCGKAFRQGVHLPTTSVCVLVPSSALPPPHSPATRSCGVRLLNPSRLPFSSPCPLTTVHYTVSFGLLQCEAIPAQSFKIKIYVHVSFPFKTLA